MNEVSVNALTVPEATVEAPVKFVALTTVAPEIAPVAEILIEGVFKKLLKPVAEAKLIPLIRPRALLFAASKLIPLVVSIPKPALLASTNVKSIPLTVVPVITLLLLVTLRAKSFDASAVRDVSVRLAIVPDVAVEVTVSPVAPAMAPAEVI